VDDAGTRDEYIQQVLNTYRVTPGTSGMIRRPDRLLAEQWHGRRIPLSIVENAMVLAVFRRPSARQVFRRSTPFDHWHTSRR